jgi:hypothetical protein
MIRFLGDEMTLNLTLLVWELMVTSKALVSCVTGLDENPQPSMTSIGISVFFFTRANLYCCTNFLSMKHVDALKSRNAWASIVTCLSHLIMFGIKKHGVGAEDSRGPFSSQNA